MKIMKFSYKLIDLSHPLKEGQPSWDAQCGFAHKNSLDYKDCTTDVKFRVQTIEMSCGFGTHIDAPAHCMPSGKTIDELDLNDLISPCVVIDISQKAHAGYQCTIEDIINFENQYQLIEPHYFVIIWTGWSKYWDFPEKYRNHLMFPTVSKEAAELLIARNILGLGVDTLGPDTPESGYPVHQIMLSQGKYLVENIAYAPPATGSFVLIAPLPIVGGTEAPVRLIGLIKDET
jgi:kynurenine formamidase